MGQKIHPGGLRVGIIHDWRSNWFTEKEFSDYLIEDVNIRRHINGKLAHAGISDILIRKDKQKVTVDIYTARPGIVIGKSGSEVDALRKEIGAMTHKGVHININEIKRPELDYRKLMQVPSLGPGVADAQVAEQVEIGVKYAGYLDRQREEIERQQRHEHTAIPAGFDYTGVRGLSAEVTQKLERVQPATIGQAQRIPGMTPAAISLLLVHLERMRRSRVA